MTLRDLQTKEILKVRESLYKTKTPPDGTPPVRLAGQKNRLYPGRRGILDALMDMVSTSPRTSGFELTIWRYNGSLGFLSLNWRPAPGFKHSTFKGIFLERIDRFTFGQGTLYTTPKWGGGEGEGREESGDRTCCFSTVASQQRLARSRARRARTR